MKRPKTKIWIATIVIEDPDDLFDRMNLENDINSILENDYEIQDIIVERGI